MNSIIRDFQYAWRGLRRSPAFAAIAILTLALGIGANTAIFSIIDAVLLRPLPFHNPGQLVRLYETEDAPGNYPFTGPDFLDWKTQNHSFQDMSLYGWPNDMNFNSNGQPDHVTGTATEANFFSLLGVRPLLGRTFAQGEDEPGKDRVVILSYGLWQDRFAGDSNILGRSITLNDRKYDVIGVMPAGIRYPGQSELWIPQDMDTKHLRERGSHWLNAVGRLKPGVTLQQAQAEMTLIARRLEQQYPDSNHRVGASLVGMHEALVGDSRTSLLLMLGAVLLVLLIACANLANLLLSRAYAREREIAIRGALGAGRWRLVRQLLSESLLLSMAGGLLGLLIAWGGLHLLTTLKHVGLPRTNNIEINLPVLAFTFGVAILTGLAFGLFPALQTARASVCEALKGGAGAAGSTAHRQHRVGDSLVVVEIALSLLLLVSAALLLKDFLRIRNTEIGLRTEGVWTASVMLPQERYEKQQQQFEFSQSLLQKLQNIPGIESASVTDQLPLEQGNNGYVILRGSGSTGMSGPLVEEHSITPDYFRVMGIPLLKGRAFTAEDAITAASLDKRRTEASEANLTLPPAQTNNMVYPAVINQKMARQFWPDQDPVGKMFAHGDKDGPWCQVVGVVGDVKEWSLTHDPVPEAYSPLDGASWLTIVVHTASPLSVTPEIRNALAQVDPTLPLISVRTMDQVIAESASGQQFVAGLLGLFAALAIVLAAIGIYGVLSYLVTQRQREIGIRMSLGATRSGVLTLMLKRGMRLAIIGFAFGLVGSFAAGKVIASVLHMVRPHDPAVLLLAPVGLAAIVLLACYIPAQRAAKVDPMVALRQE